MKNPHGDHGGGAGNQTELVVVLGDSKDILKKALLRQLSLYGSKIFSAEELKAYALAEVQEITFTEDQQAAINEEHKKKTLSTLVGVLKRLGSRAIEAHVNGLGFRQAKGPTKRLSRNAMIAIREDECRRLIHANRTDIRDAIEYLKAKKARDETLNAKRIRDFEAFHQEMEDGQSEYAGDLFPDV